MGAGLQTSEWINSRALEALKPDLSKDNWCILPLRQCLQCVIESLIGKIQDASTEDSAVVRTLLLGCPSLWCHINHLLTLFTCKAVGKQESWADWEGCDSEVDWKTVGLRKFFE